MTRFNMTRLKISAAYFVKALLTLGLVAFAPVVLAVPDPDCGEAMSNYWQLGWGESVSPLKDEMRSAYFVPLMVCVVIGIIVFGAMIFSIIFHRKGKREPAQFHHSTVVELIWTTVPVLILVGIAVSVTSLLLKQEDTSGSQLEINAIGYQWLWEYEYPEHDVAFFSKLSEASNAKRQLGAMGLSEAYDMAGAADGDCYLSDVDNELVVPVNTKILMKVSSQDVVHAWSVDAFDFKIDAYPFQNNEKSFTATKTGVYRGWCKELCGRDHAFMPIVVRVVEQAEFEAWIAQQQGQDGDSAAAPAAVSAPADTPALPTPNEPTPINQAIDDVNEVQPATQQPAAQPATEAPTTPADEASANVLEETAESAAEATEAVVTEIAEDIVEDAEAASTTINEQAQDLIADTNSEREADNAANGSAE